MARQWKSFDKATTDKEFLSIPSDDRADLFEAMLAFRKELAGGYVVKNYGGGLMMIKPSNRSHGRCLFFTVGAVGGDEVLTALLAYKKETEDAPASVIKTARQRMARAQAE